MWTAKNRRHLRYSRTGNENAFFFFPSPLVPIQRFIGSTRFWSVACLVPAMSQPNKNYRSFLSQFLKFETNSFVVCVCVRCAVCCHRQRRMEYVMRHELQQLQRRVRRTSKNERNAEVFYSKIIFKVSMRTMYFLHVQLMRTFCCCYTRNYNTIPHWWHGHTRRDTEWRVPTIRYYGS